MYPKLSGVDFFSHDNILQTLKISLLSFDGSRILSGIDQ